MVDLEGLLSRLLRPFSRVTVAGQPQPQYSTLEIGDGLTWTDDPLNSRAILTAGTGSSWARAQKLNTQVVISSAATGSPVYGWDIARNFTGASVTVNAAIMYVKGVATASDTNYWELKLSIADAYGTITTSGAQTLTTKTSGSSGTGNWDPTTPSKRRFAFGGPAVLLADGEVLALELFKHGTPAEDFPTVDIFFQ